MSQKIYLDFAAATPVDKQVVTVMQPYLAQKFYNPSASYLAAREVRHELETARAKVADIIGALSSEIVFTASATEANNLALIGVATKFPRTDIISTALEHESVLAPLKDLAAHGHHVKLINPTANGLIEPQKIIAAITDKTIMVSVMYANNEVGTIQPLRETAQGLDSIRQHRRQAGNQLPLYLHTDAAQAANYLDLHVKRLGVDLMSLNGGKVYGPKQSGALYVGRNVSIEPIIFGGGQEHGLRSGTENVAGSIGFAKALTIAQAMRPAEAKRLAKLQALFMELLSSQVPSAKINGSLKHRLPNNIHLTIPGADNERLLFSLDEAGILAAAGSACSASSDEPSPVLRSMGISKAEAQASLRFTMGRPTTEADIRHVVGLLGKLS